MYAGDLLQIATRVVGYQWLFAAPYPHQLIKNQAHSAHADGAVGHIESREVPARHVKVKEVDDVTVQGAVNYVANGSTQNAGYRKRKQLLPGMGLEHPDNEDGRRYTDAGKKPALPAASCRKKGERSASVVHPDHIEETGDVGRITQAVVTQNQHLGELVGNDQ